MNLSFFSEYFHREAEKLRIIDKAMSKDMLLLAEHILNDFILCEECGGIMTHFQKLCPGSEDYKVGFREIRQCSDCGEMEVK